METLLNAIWYGNHPLRWALYPFSLIFHWVSSLRRYGLCRWRQKNFSVPVIVVGNISTGGVGKTPLVIAIANQLVADGLRVGIVSRGYKAQSSYFPRLINDCDTALEVGDEPLLMAQKTGCPVVIDPDRSAAVEFLLRQCAVHIIISDDGLQHYRMGRQCEIAVIDGQRGLGNGFCLPAGPLRESARRLQQVDFIMVNQGAWPGAEPMTLEIEGLYHIASGVKTDPETLAHPIIAMAGIGNPMRFYTTLSSLGLVFETKNFPDHHCFSESDFTTMKSHSIIMTEKDAIKCRAFAPENSYYLAVKVLISDAFWQNFKNTLQEKIKHYEIILS